jgi:hypothetical protein
MIPPTNTLTREHTKEMKNQEMKYHVCYWRRKDERGISGRKSERGGQKNRIEEV